MRVAQCGGAVGARGSTFELSTVPTTHSEVP
jgi:hypothetical protein